MSTGTFRLALACTFTSLAAVALSAGGTPQAPPAGEIDLARRAGVYLRVDAEARVLEVKARGMSLESFPLTAIELLLFESGAAVESPALPVVWIVEEAPEADHRRRLEPAQLRPYQAEDPPPGSAVPAATADAPKSTGPPATYRVRLEGGWVLAVGEELPGSGFASTARLAAPALWARLRGRPFAPAHILALALDTDAARKLHHVFQPGLALLVE